MRLYLASLTRSGHLAEEQRRVIAARVATHLLRLPIAPDYAVAPGAGHQPLADAVGISRALVTLALVHIREIGALEMSQHGVLITNHRMLAHVAHGAN